MILKSRSFFDEAPTIVMHDALGQFLGATEDGLIEYQYADAVALAGHSCPTVAAAWLMTRSALSHLYPDSVPERGEVAVAWRDPRASGVTGVMASVAQLVTGAADESGFKGIAGNFQRSELMSFEAPIRGEVRFTRKDNGVNVEVSANVGKVPMDPKMRELLILCLTGDATPEDARAFGSAWQARVSKLLLEHADDPEVIVVHP